MDPEPEPEMTTPQMPAIHVNRDSPIPLYHQVAMQIEAAIRSGELSVGAWLDNEIELANRLGVSRPTMRQAISQLVDAGFLVRRRGVGTRVVTDSIVRPVALTSLHTDLKEAGLEVNTRVELLREVAAADDLAELFGTDATLIEIKRVRGVPSGPIALMHNWIPARFAGVTADSLADQGLYDLMRAEGADLKTAHQLIGARAATPAEAALLGTTAGAACVTMKRRTHDPMGPLLEVGDHLDRGDRYQFTSTLTAR
ncbi:MAG: GntR family transcriptional regulator [Bifidobacteriaceae bacterium]|jgi:DNA-binding GntR family transcriptional regulator|nr:GntR family transcriptional regulator [Bifidobacteriaceae bacterium]